MLNASFNATDDIALAFGQIIINDTGDKRYYNFTLSGVAAEFSQNNVSSLGPEVTNKDPVQPLLGEFAINPNTWTRFWIRIEQRANDYDYVDMWVADENTEPVQIYSHIPVSMHSSDTPATNNSIFKSWLEFNTSHDIFVRGDLRDLVTYVRNFVALINPPADIAGLLKKPVK